MTRAASRPRPTCSGGAPSPTPISLAWGTLQPQQHRLQRLPDRPDANAHRHADADAHRHAYHDGHADTNCVGLRAALRPGWLAGGRGTARPRTSLAQTTER